MATAGATDGQTQEAKGGVKFELVGIPDVMLEENKKEKKKPDTNPGVLVFDMGTDVKAPAKKPALSSVKKGQGAARPGGRGQPAGASRPALAVGNLAGAPKNLWTVACGCRVRQPIESVRATPKCRSREIFNFKQNSQPPQAEFGCSNSGCRARQPR